MRRSDLERARRHPLETVQELTIALGHVPALLKGRRVTDGYAQGDVVVDAKAALADARQHGDISPEWRFMGTVPTVSDVAVARIGTKADPDGAFLKIAMSEEGDRSLKSQQRALVELAGDERLDGWRELVPGVLASGVIAERYYLIESVRGGVELSTLVNSEVWQKALSSAMDAIAPLHVSTGSLVTMDESRLGEWIEPALDALAKLRTTMPARTRYGRIERLRRRLHREMEGRSVWISRTHGDYSPNNVLMDPATGGCLGIVDWDRSMTGQPSFVDGCQFALTSHLLVNGGHFGSLVRDLLEGKRTRIAGGAGLGAPMGDGDAGAELDLMNRFWNSYPGDRLSLATAALITWLHHVQSNVDKSSKYTKHKLWTFRTADIVLSSIS